MVKIVCNINYSNVVNYVENGDLDFLFVALSSTKKKVIRMIQKRRLDELDFARAFALFGVLAVHSSSTGVGGTPSDSFMYYVYNFFNVFGKLGTPTFIFLSSFVLFYTYYNKPLNSQLLKRFYGNRLTYILVPYLVFSIIYYVLKMFIAYGFSNLGEQFMEFLHLLSIGKAHTHLYFVYISVQFYLLFPLFLLLFKKVNWVRKWAIPIGIIVQWLWVYMNANYFHVTAKASISLSYMEYYFTGAFFGIYYEQILKWVRNWKKSVIVVGMILFGYGFVSSFYIFVIYFTRKKELLFPNIIHEFIWSTNAFFASITIFFLSHLAKEIFGERTKKVLTEIGAVSFGVYLIHPLFLFFLREMLPGNTPLLFHGWQVITYILMFAGSWAVVRFTYNYIPYSWIIFGKGKSTRKKNIEKL